MPGIMQYCRGISGKGFGGPAPRSQGAQKKWCPFRNKKEIRKTERKKRERNERRGKDGGDKEEKG